MAARTSAAAGNWSAPATWTGGLIPGNGDTATITHDVVVTANQIVGTSPASGTTAVTVNSGGKLTLATGITFTCRGDIRFNGTTFQMNAGSTFKFDASQFPTTPLSQHYFMYFSHSASSILTVNGTAGSRCTITSDALGGSGAIARTDVWHPTIRYCDITRLGQSGVAAIEMGGGYSTFDLEQVVLDTCGEMTLSYLGATAIVRLVNVTRKNTLSAFSTTNGGTPVALTTGVRLMQGCVFDKVVWNTWLDWTVTDTVFTGGIGVSGTTALATFSGNLLEWPTNYDQQIRGDVVDTYCFANHTETNPHYLQLEATGTVRGCIFEYLGTAANGDCVMPGTPGAPVTITIENCIGLPNAGNGSPGSHFSLLGNANVTLVSRHNTWFVGNKAGGIIGETYTGHAGMVTQYRDNLFWDTAATNYKLLNGSGTAVDQVAASAIHHNAGYNVLLPGSNGKGYHGLVLSSGAPGASDVDGVDPQFVDPARDVQKWDASIAGGAGSVAHALAELKKKNEPGYNVAYHIAGLLAYVKAGFVPQATAYQAASDVVTGSNGWIGAMEGMPPAGGGALYTLLAHGAAGSTDNLTAAISGGAALNTTGANLLVAGVAEYDPGAATFCTVSDSVGGNANVWTPCTTYGPPGTGETQAKLWWTVPTYTGPGHTFLASPNAGAFPFPILFVAAFSGGHATPFVAESGFEGTGSASIQPGALTPALPNCLAISLVARTSGAITSISGAGWIILDNVPSGGAHNDGALAYQIQTTATLTNPTWNLVGGADASTAMAIFKPGVTTPAVVPDDGLLLLGVG
jgi:hypothetical protein